LVGLALPLALAFLSGCSLQERARETFAQDQSCPLEKVTAVPRPELSVYDLTFGGLSHEPSPEIAADPARRAIWQAKQDESKRTWDKSATLFEVRGCNEKKYYACRNNKSRSCSSLTAKVP